MALELRPGLTLYFARHGETVANVERRFQGHNDTPMTEHGRMQARMLAAILVEVLAGQSTPRFVSSPLPRARATMEIILDALGQPRNYTTDPRLMEIDLGDWSGLTDEGLVRSTRRCGRSVSTTSGMCACQAGARTTLWSPNGS